MTFAWKMTVFAAAGCFVLSLLTGIFAGVHFWALVFRALLMGILGGALALTLRWLVLRFLPELSRELAGERSEPMGDTGKKVDIVVADEAAPGSSPDRETEEEPAAALQEVVAVESEDGDSGDFAEELEELKASPILTAKGDESEVTYQPVKPPEVIEDVDVLPDLESFQDSFAIQDLTGENGNDSAPESRPAQSGSGSRGGGVNDADTIAQAIRTALHRDKKG